MEQQKSTAEQRREERSSVKFTEVNRDRPREAVRPLVQLLFHVEAQGGVQT